MSSSVALDPAAAVVAVDVGKRSAAVLVTDAARCRLLGLLDFSMGGAGLAEVISKSRAVLPAGLIRVGVEAAGHYHRPLATPAVWPGWQGGGAEPGPCATRYQYLPHRRRQDRGTVGAARRPWATPAARAHAGSYRHHGGDLTPPTPPRIAVARPCALARPFSAQVVITTIDADKSASERGAEVRRARAVARRSAELPLLARPIFFAEAVFGGASRCTMPSPVFRNPTLARNGHPAGRYATCRYCPTRPSMHSRRRSACPQCRAYSSIR